METDYLYEYLTLAKCGSFTAAARELHITQSTLSKHIATLERDFGTDLFIRERSGTKLTQAGKVLYTQAAKIDQLVNQTYEAVARAQDTASDVEITHDDATHDIDLRRATIFLAEQHGLSEKETGALIMFLEERDFKAIQEELETTRDEVGEILGSAYRKLNITSKQEALNLIETLKGDV